jgi:hypothetical protein
MVSMKTEHVATLVIPGADECFVFGSNISHVQIAKKRFNQDYIFTSATALTTGNGRRGRSSWFSFYGGKICPTV